MNKNNLSAQEQEILLITAEEAAEVTQVISKVLRFGLDNTHPDTGVSNRDRLVAEIGDITCMIYLLQSKGLIDQEQIEVAARNKFNKLKKWSSIDLDAIKI